MLAVSAGERSRATTIIGSSRRTAWCAVLADERAEEAIARRTRRRGGAREMYASRRPRRAGRTSRRSLRSPPRPPTRRTSSRGGSSARRARAASGRRASSGTPRGSASPRASPSACARRRRGASASRRRRACWTRSSSCWICAVCDVPAHERRAEVAEHERGADGDARRAGDALERHARRGDRGRTTLGGIGRRRRRDQQTRAVDALAVGEPTRRSTADPRDARSCASPWAACCGVAPSARLPEAHGDELADGVRRTPAPARRVAVTSTTVPFEPQRRSTPITLLAFADLALDARADVARDTCERAGRASSRPARAGRGR